VEGAVAFNEDVEVHGEVLLQEDVKIVLIPLLAVLPELEVELVFVFAVVLHLISRCWLLDVAVVFCS